MAYGVSEDGMTMEQYMDKFKVPFVIWANYPLTGEKPGITSLNFLAQYVLRDAGIQTSAFGSYLWNLTKTIPAMTFAGYFDSEGNAYSHLETTEMTDLIRQYQTVQYNELFRRHRQAEQSVCGAGLIKKNPAAVHKTAAGSFAFSGPD